MKSAQSFSRQEIEDMVVIIRLELYNRGLPCGPERIRKQMDEVYHVLPMPSKTTIAHILSKKCLTHQRTGWYAEDNLLPTTDGLENEE